MMQARHGAWRVFRAALPAALTGKDVMELSLRTGAPGLKFGFVEIR